MARSRLRVSEHQLPRLDYVWQTVRGADLGDLGHWEIEDIATARDWLVEQGIARPDQILLTGWSYGGYLTLQFAYEVLGASGGD